MPTDRFFIAPYDQKSGMQTNVKPWLIPDEAFSQLINAYVFRGRVRKRFGSRYFGNSANLSRLKILVDTSDGGGSSSGTVPSASGAIGQAFSIGTNFFTVNALGTPANLLISGAASTATFNTSTGVFVFTGVTALTSVYWYPALPVMGLLTYENNPLQNEFLIGFDTKYAYQYVTATGWERLATESDVGAATWIGNNSQFFWSTTWSGTNASDRVFFVTNFNQNETNFMRYFVSSSWHNFVPQIDATPNYLMSARVLVVFKNRLLAFNTWEGPGPTVTGTNYINRCRYSALGSPLDSMAFRQDIPGKGNAVDAPTSEAIVTVEFVKDRLIVFFEQSAWEIIYQGNQAYPFAWQKINPELGAESTFSIIPIASLAIGVGNVGVMACNGSSVERIDEKIPDEVFKIHNADNGIFRVYGIRDYYVEMLYWTFPSGDASSIFPYPNRILVYNYKNGTWAFNNDSITVFGYFQPQTGITWDSTTVTWDDAVSWDSGSVQALFRQVVAGNQEGFTFIVDADVPTNASVIQITNLTVTANIVTITAIDHNFRQDEYIYLQGITGTGNLNLINGKIFKIINSSANPITANTFSFIYKDDSGTIIAGTYSGSGLISRVSNIDIKTKEYNFYAQEGRNAYVSQINFMVDTTSAGAIQVDFFVSTSLTPLLQDSQGQGVLLGTGTLDTFPYTAANVPAPVQFEENTSRVWHPVYIFADGEVIQLQLTMNDAQMRDTDIRTCDFQLHAMCIYAEPTSFRLQ